jgi:hypothetical protein
MKPLEFIAEVTMLAIVRGAESLETHGLQLKRLDMVLLLDGREGHQEGG